MMNKVLYKMPLTLLLLFLCLDIYAYDVYIDGLYYNADLNNKTVSVTSGDIKYSGDIIVPSSIVINGKELPVVSVSSTAFQSCPNLKSVVLSNGIKTIEGYAFYNSENLQKIVLPESIISIDNNAFWNCSSLEVINIPNSITRINDYLFYYCSSLQNITLPKGLISIGEAAFYGCSSLESIVLPQSVEKLDGRYIFSKSGIKSISIPGRVWTITCNIFDNCPNLNEVIFEDTDTEYLLLNRGMCDLLMGFQDVTIFDNCPLESFYFGRNIYDYKQTIKISSTTLKSLTIGKDTRKFFDISSCSNIEKVESKSLEPSDLGNLFSNWTYMYGILYVPIGSKSKYESAEGWKKFFNIQEKDIPNDIMTMETSPSSKIVYYDLRGQKLNKAKAGINIIHDSNRKVKKVIVK